MWALLARGRVHRPYQGDSEKLVISASPAEGSHTQFFQAVLGSTPWFHLQVGANWDPRAWRRKPPLLCRETVPQSTERENVFTAVLDSREDLGGNLTTFSQTGYRTEVHTHRFSFYFPALKLESSLFGICLFRIQYHLDKGLLEVMVA